MLHQHHCRLRAGYRPLGDGGVIRTCSCMAGCPIRVIAPVNMREGANRASGLTLSYKEDGELAIEVRSYSGFPL